MPEIISGEELRHLATVPVLKVVGEGCLALRHDAPASAAVREMTENDLGAVAVEDDVGRVVGIFTERDVLLRGLSEGEEWLASPLSKLMTPDPVTVTASDSVAEAIHRMKEGHFRHLPVIDEQGRAVAMLSIRRVIADLAEHFPAEVQNLPPDPKRESRNLYGG
ncbi:MAG: CBS domain-containing protein [Acidobacteria bacterium]|nr:MAG: CBS domain-containing protein [Acidobacteriota bacterium]